eukprot:1582836-Amphidinium_carterae.1
MLRSGVNALAVAPERIVLPRGSEVVEDALHCWQRCSPSEGIELLSANFADAFLTLPLHEAERGYAVIVNDLSTPW